MRKIKLFVDAHVFDNEFQGSRTFIKELYHLLSLKKDLELLLGAHDVENLKENFSDCENITYIQYKSSSSIKRLLFEIPSIIKKHQIDYAHFQYIVPPVKKCKYIVTIHDVIFNDYPKEFSLTYRLKKNLLYGMSAHRSDIITTVSKYSKNSIQTYLRTKNSEIYITPNGVNHDFFKPFDKKKSKSFIKETYNIKNYILFVSRFEPRKNHLLLLKTYLGLKLYERGYYLVLLGHTSIKIPEFEYLLTELPQSIRQFIYISSHVNNHDLSEFYRGAEVFVYPSKAEGFGIPPLEAAALKIPTICSNTSAMGDFSFFGSYHIDPTDSKLFEEKLNNILTTPPTDDELEEISNKIAIDYSWSKSAEILYQAIINNYICK